MGSGRRFLRFAAGGVVGFVGGVLGAVLLAPESGGDTRRKIERRVQEAKVAGVEAQAAAQQELIDKYRASTGMSTALEDDAARVRIERAEALRAVGLGLNAPGALAAHAAQDRPAG